MRTGQLDNVLDHIRSLVAARQTRELPDRELLERFATQHDEAAFAALVERHGPLVLGVCRRILRSEHHAEDACQAAFLVLARKAGTIRKREALGSWLYGVASRVARKLNTDVKRRSSQKLTEADVSVPDSTGEITWREGLAVLDEELNRLPPTYRSALVLCYLEGRTHDEAARELACSAGALCGRLVRARECLRRRLVRRGVGLSAALLGTLLVSTQAAAALPPALTIRTVQAAAALLGGQALGRVVPAQVANLTQGVLTTMFITRVKTGAALVLAASLLAAAAALAGAARSEKAPPPAPEAGPPALAFSSTPVQPDKQTTPADEDSGKVLTVRGRVLDPAGKPFAGAQLYLHASHRGAKSDVARATSGDDGRFQFTVARSELDRSPTGYKATALGDPAPDQVTSQVLALANGYGCAWSTIGESDAKRELTLRLLRDVPISGRILDRDGKPVAGARVRVGHVAAYPGEDLTMMLKAFPQKGWHAALQPVAYWAGPLPGQADVIAVGADGRFHLSGFGRERTVYLTVEGPAIESSAIWVMTRVGKDVFGPSRKVYAATFDHLAAPSRLIRGVVRDKASGKPLAGVRVYYDHLPLYGTSPTAQTDKDGRYELLGCPKSPTFKLCIVPPDGRHFGRQVHLEDRAGFQPVVADIDMPSGIRVEGRILDKASGKPIAGVRVSYYPLFENAHVIRPEEYLLSPEPLSSTTTGPDGAFAVAALPGPGFLAAAAQPLSAYRPALITPRELEEFLKDRPHRVNSLDILGVYPTGLPNLAAPWLILQHDYHALALIHPGENDRTLVRDLVVLPPLTRQLALVGPDGKPLPGVTVLSLGGANQDVTLKSATCTVRGLHPGRPRQLCFYHREKNLGCILDLRGEQTEPLRVELQPCGSASGRFVDKGGKPVGGMPVQLDRDVDSKIRTDRDGRFRVERLIPGRKYSLTRFRNGGFSNVVLDLLPPFSVKPGENKELGDLTVTVQEPEE